MKKPYTTGSSFVCSAQWRRVRHWLSVSTFGALLALHHATWAQSPRPGVTPPAATTSPPSYPGLWYDHSNDGAVEILPCGDRLCGRIVWLRSPLDKTDRPFIDDFNTDPKRRQRPICGLDVIGGLKRQPGGTWDEGWIYDPKQGKQFDVELKLLSAEKLQVMGYMGVKFLSETFVWKRAPADLKRCGA